MPCLHRDLHYCETATPQTTCSLASDLGPTHTHSFSWGFLSIRDLLYLPYMTRIIPHIPHLYPH